MRFDGDDEDDLEHQEQPGGEEADAEEGHEDDAASEGDQEERGRADAREGQEQEGQAEPVKRSRGDSRFQALANENKEYRARLDRQQREFEEFRQSLQRQQSQPDPEVERRKLEMMTPEERMEYRLEQSERRHTQELQRMQFDSWNNSDQVKFQGLVSSNQLVAKHKEEIEAIFVDRLRAGQPVDRETIAAYAIGKAALAQGAKSLKKAQDAGKKRIEGQRVAPSNPRGNVPADRRGGKSLEERLDGVTF